MILFLLIIGSVLSDLAKKSIKKEYFDRNNCNSSISYIEYYPVDTCIADGGYEYLKFELVDGLATDYEIVYYITSSCTSESTKSPDFVSADGSCDGSKHIFSYVDYIPDVPSGYVCTAYYDSFTCDVSDVHFISCENLFDDPCEVDADYNCGDMSSIFDGYYMEPGCAGWDYQTVPGEPGVYNPAAQAIIYVILAVVLGGPAACCCFCICVIVTILICCCICGGVAVGGKRRPNRAPTTTEMVVATTISGQNQQPMVQPIGGSGQPVVQQQQQQQPQIMQPVNVVQQQQGVQQKPGEQTFVQYTQQVPMQMQNQQGMIMPQNMNPVYSQQ